MRVSEEEFKAMIKAHTRPKSNKRPLGDVLPQFKSPRNEGAVVAACMQWLYDNGCIAMRNNTGALPASYTRKDGSVAEYRVRFGRKGWSDIIACSPTGKYIEVECKAGYGKQQPDQFYHQEEVEQRKGIYVLAYSVDDLEARKTELLG